MKKPIAIVLLSVCIVTLVAILVVVLAGSGASPNNAEFKREFSATARDISQIDISLIFEDLEFGYTDGAEIEVTQTASGRFREDWLADTRINGSTLEITSPSSLGQALSGFTLFGPRGYSRVTVSIPKAWKQNLNASTSSGDISARDVLLADAHLESTSGAISVEDLETASCSLRSTSGDLILHNLSSSHLSAHSTSGVVKAEANVSNEVLLEATSGDIGFTGVAGSLSADTSSGTINIDAPIEGDADLAATSGDITFTGSASLLKCDTSSGQIRVDTRSIDAISCTSTSGDVCLQVSDASTLAKVECGTSSGSVDIVLPEGITVTPTLDSSSGTLNTSHANGLVLASDGIPVEVHTSSGDLQIRSAS